MSLNTMIQEMLLEIPGIASSQAKKYLNRALELIYGSQMWSWQLKTSGWLTPGLLFPSGPGTSVGTVAVTAFSPLVAPSLAAKNAWLAYTGMPLFTQLQFRSPFYSLYNIIAINPVTGILTLDRPWMEPTNATATYMIYQAYFPVPVPDFKRFLSARDTTNDWPMDYWSKSQKDLAVEDAERTIFDDPNYFVPFEQDQRPNSATFGNMLYELWPHPLSVLPYTYQYLRMGPLLQNPNDTLPYPLTESPVVWRAKEVAGMFKEANKGEDMQRGQGADWKFIIQEAREQFKLTIKPVKDRDSDLVSLYFSKYRPDMYNNGEPFATVNGQLNIGRF
jgi:hypothetical protein